MESERQPRGGDGVSDIHDTEDAAVHLWVYPGKQGGWNAVNSTAGMKRTLDIRGSPLQSGACSEEIRASGRAGHRQLRGAFSAGWPRHECWQCGRLRAFHHEPDGKSLGSDGEALYPG